MFSGSSNHKDIFVSAVRQAQARFTLESSRTILIANLVAAATACGLIIPLHDNIQLLMVWVAILVVCSVFRFSLALLLEKHQYARKYPGDVVKLMSAAALLQGLTWGLLPVAFIKMDLLGQDAPIMLILIGLAGTALLRQSFTSQTAFSYSIPIVLACAWCFMQRGGLVALVSTVDLLLMAGFLLFLMTKAEQRFIEGELAKLTSDHATKSLLRANEDIRQSNIRLEVLANCDPVTGLFNRTYLGGNIAGALAAATVSNRQVALVLFDIDRFKRINDTFGHCGGDQFLTILGQRLRAEAGANAIVARISGDEFAALITAGDVRQQSAALLKTMVECDLAPVTINGTAISPGLSAGLAFFPANGEDADELFNAASMALSEAKLAGRKQWREFDLQFKQAINRQRQIEQDLKEAITNNDITTWFQPQINLELGTVVSFEALVRWLHPVFGAISPPEIINAAHAMNLSETLTRRLANNVCSMLKELPAHGFPDAVVALNVSPREFALYNVAKMLDDITAEHGVQRNLLEIELTEESILDPETAGEQLLQMEINGYRLAVDDFGMGYSSLAYLISLKIDRLKIDRSIITDISESGANQALVTAMVGLGRALHVEIVVEGVETVDDANTLTSIGCDIAQGFYFARPMPSDVLFHWLEQNTRKNLNNNLQLASA